MHIGLFFVNYMILINFILIILIMMSSDTNDVILTINLIEDMFVIITFKIGMY